MSDEIAISVSNLGKCYHIYDASSDRLKQFVLPRLQRLIGRPPRPYFRSFWALKDLSFEVRKGETIGIIGRNGSGKSTLLQILAGTLTPTNGEVNTNGRIAALLELGSGFNQEFTGRENVLLNGQILGLSPEEIEARYEQIVEFSEIGEFIDQPVKTYSSGMFVRLAFAVQAHIDASIVIIDEALAVGDIFFRQKCYARLEQLKQSGAAILLVSHSMPDIEQYCERAILLDHGAPLFIGTSVEAAKHYYLIYQGKASTPRVPDIVLTETRPTSPQDELWPMDCHFRDASAVSQVSNGMARCVRLAVCNTRGHATLYFSQGDTAIFCYEFLLAEPISTPLGGIVIRNDKGILVHGKGSLEYGIITADYLPAGTLVRCRQSIELRVGTGEYSFELGLASISPEDYRNRSRLSHEELFSRITRICHISGAGAFSVGPRKIHEGSQLTHHGVADLPGDFTLTFTHA